jgi:hypothetical protein
VVRFVLGIPIKTADIKGHRHGYVVDDASLENRRRKSANDVSLMR